MNEVQPVLQPGYVIWLAIPIALYALYQAIRTGYETVKRFQYRNHQFSDPELQRLADSLPPRPIWRDALWVLVYFMIAVLTLLPVAYF